MKKNYITPRIKLSKNCIESSICRASFQTGDEYTSPSEVEHSTDPTLDPGAKNRFYGDSDDSWE